MSEPTYVQQLRAIRDAIGEELQRSPWEQWDKRAREEVGRHPKLARLLSEADQAAPAEARLGP